jgi:hypothetical protein
MASAIYNSFKKDIMDGTLDLDTNTLYALLCTSTYTPNIDTHTRRSDITNEVSTTNYTAGGTEITGKSLTNDTTNDRTYLDGNDVSWASVTLTSRYCVVYRSSGSGSASDQLICYFDFGSDQTATSGTFTVQWSSAGILRLS